LALGLPSAFDIMISQNGVEIDAVAKEWRKGTFEVLIETAPVAVWIDIVTGGDHQIQRRAAMSIEHLFRNAVGIITTGTPVTNDGESDFALGRLCAEDRNGLD
jgi:hypothetical protein